MTLKNCDLRCNSDITAEAATTLAAAVLVALRSLPVRLLISLSPQEHQAVETVSGIPLRTLLQNDAELTKLDLSDSGCRVFEAAMLAAVLKVLLGKRAKERRGEARRGLRKIENFQRGGREKRVGEIGPTANNNCGSLSFVNSNFCLLVIVCVRVIFVSAFLLVY